MKVLESYKELKDSYQKNLILKDDNLNSYNGGTYFKPALAIIPDEISQCSIIGDDLNKTFNFDNRNRFVVYNYYKKRSHLATITDILLNYLELSTSSTKEEIVEKVESFEKVDYQKRLLLLLELTGIIDTKKIYNYSYKKRISIIIREFSLFMGAFATEVFENSSKPLFLEIRNIDNISRHALELFLSSLKGTLANYPIFVLVYGSIKTNPIMDEKFNLLQLIINSPISLYLEINKQYTEDQTKLYNYTSIEDQAIIYALKKMPDTYNEDMFSEYFYALSPMCQKLLGFFLFFDGQLFLNSIQYIQTNNGKYPSNELSTLHKDGMIIFEKNFAIISSKTILSRVSQFYKEDQFLQDNISTLSEIIGNSFKTSTRRYYEYYSTFYNKIFGVEEVEDFSSSINKYESDGESLLLAKIYEQSYDKLEFNESDDTYYFNVYLKSLVDLENFDTIYDITSKNSEKFTPKKRVINNYYRAVSLMEKEERSEAIEVINSAIEEATFIDDQLWIAKSYHFLGELHHRYYDLVLATKNYQEAQVFYKNLDYNGEIVKIYYSLGKIYYENNDLKAAMDALSMGILFYQKTSGLSIDLIYAKINYLSAIISNKEREFEISSQHFNKALNIFYTFMDYGYLTKCYSNLSDLYLDRDPEKSATYLHKSLLYTQAAKDDDNSIETYWILSRYYLLQNNIEKSKQITKKALQYSVKLKNKDQFYRFIERIGDIYYYENRFQVAKKCYKYAFKKYSNQGNKISIPSLLFKMATLYAETGRFNSSNKILDRLDQPDYEYFLNYDNQFNFNNIVIENFISQKRFDDVAVFLDKQQSFLSKDGITLKNKIGFHKIKSVYCMMTGDMDGGREHHQKALDFCTQKNLYIDEIKLQLKVASVLANIGIKKSSLKILDSLTPLSKKVESKYLTKYILRTIFKL